MTPGARVHVLGHDHISYIYVVKRVNFFKILSTAEHRSDLIYNNDEIRNFMTLGLVLLC